MNKIVKLPIGSYDIQVWNHGIGFKHNSYQGETDTNGFYHTHTGLGRWCDYEIISIKTEKDYIVVELTKNTNG